MCAMASSRSFRASMSARWAVSRIPLGEGADQGGHNGVGLLTLQLIPCVPERLGNFLGLIGFEAGF